MIIKNNSTKYIKYIVAFAICLFSVFSCTHNNTFLNRQKDKEKGDAIVKAFYSKIDGKDFNGTLSMCSDTLFKTASKNDFVSLLTRVYSQLGSLKSYSVEKWETKVVVGNSLSEYYKYQMKISYERGNTSELLIIHRESNGVLKIIVYNIYS